MAPIRSSYSWLALLVLFSAAHCASPLQAQETYQFNFQKIPDTNGNPTSPATVSPNELPISISSSVSDPATKHVSKIGFGIASDVFTNTKEMSGVSFVRTNYLWYLSLDYEKNFSDVFSLEASLSMLNPNGNQRKLIDGTLGVDYVPFHLRLFNRSIGDLGLIAGLMTYQVPVISGGIIFDPGYSVEFRQGLDAYLGITLSLKLTEVMGLKLIEKSSYRVPIGGALYAYYAF